MSSGRNCQPKIQVLELFSGIGGVHYALEESGIPHEVVAAVDINDQANAVYRHNFPGTKLMQRCIESLTLKELNHLSPDLIHMSPPCQPFTRVGKQQDSADKRTKSFFCILELLPKLAKRPPYILVENVKGFETSDTRNSLIAILDSCGYVVQEMLLSPVQFGIPNSRLRYYLLAKLSPLRFHFPTSSELQTELPECVTTSFLHHGKTSASCHCMKRHSIDETLATDKYQRRDGCFDHERHCGEASDTETSDTNGTGLVTSCETIVTSDLTECDHSGSRLTDSDASVQAIPSASVGQVDVPLYEKYAHRCGTLADYLEHEQGEYFTPYLLPEKFFRRVWSMDLVTENVRHSCCFTKRYGHHVEGAGSVFQMNTVITTNLDKYKTTDHKDDVHFLDAVRTLKLRYFTPREIANLMGFPTSFTFPDGVSPIQCYRLLGNSLNVHVVSVLLRLLTADDSNC